MRDVREMREMRDERCCPHTPHPTLKQLQLEGRSGFGRDLPSSMIMTNWTSLISNIEMH